MRAAAFLYGRRFKGRVVEAAVVFVGGLDLVQRAVGAVEQGAGVEPWRAEGDADGQPHRAAGRRARLRVDLAQNAPGDGQRGPLFFDARAEHGEFVAADAPDDVDAAGGGAQDPAGAGSFL